MMIPTSGRIYEILEADSPRSIAFDLCSTKWVRFLSKIAAPPESRPMIRLSARIN